MCDCPLAVTERLSTMRLAALVLLLLGSSYGAVTQVSLIEAEEEATDQGSGKMIEFMISTCLFE